MSAGGTDRHENGERIAKGGDDMKEDGTLTEQEQATICEAMAIMSRWLEAHRDDKPDLYGYWGIEEAHRQLRTNFRCMRGE